MTKSETGISNGQRNGRLTGVVPRSTVRRCINAAEVENRKRVCVF